MKKQRGVFEKHPGSGIWWICYFDSAGKKRREKAGTKSAAIQLYYKRKTEALQGVKLPERLRARSVSFADLAKDTLDYSQRHKLSHRQDACRMAYVIQEFGARAAEAIAPQEIDCWIESHDKWTRGTKNRYLALLKLTYRLGNQNGKVKSNPVRFVRQRRENNARVRFLLPEEEEKLRRVIDANYQFHLPEFNIALNTGMRLSEQYNTEWAQVDFRNRLLTIPRSKNGDMRHIALNSDALSALKSLRTRVQASKHVFISIRGDKRLYGPRHWFDAALKEAGVGDFTWHDLRHTFASRLVMAGVDLRTVQELMGHKNIQMTCRYAHLAPLHQLAAVEKLALRASSALKPSGHLTGTAVKESMVAAPLLRSPTDTTSDTEDKATGSHRGAAVA